MAAGAEDINFAKQATKDPLRKESLFGASQDGSVAAGVGCQHNPSGLSGRRGDTSYEPGGGIWCAHFDFAKIMPVFTVCTQFFKGTDDFFNFSKTLHLFKAVISYDGFDFLQCLNTLHPHDLCGFGLRTGGCGTVYKK